MSTTDTIVRDGQATGPIREERRHRPQRTAARIGALVVTLGAATATALALWAAGTERLADPPVSVLMDPPAAHQPGGSVYEQQVPNTQDWSAGYGPGGYLYDAQVPELPANIRIP